MRFVIAIDVLIDLDDSAMSNALQIGIEVRAAIADIGFVVDPVTGEQTVGPFLIDEMGFEADVMAIQSFLRRSSPTRPTRSARPWFPYGG